MLRWTIVASLVCLPLLANGDKRMSGGKAGVVGKEDCAAMLRAKSALPVKLAELLAQVADNFEAHAKWLRSNNDQASKAEADYLTKLAKEQREVVSSIQKIAKQMQTARFEPAPHPQAAMASKQAMTEAMNTQAALERQMATLLRNDAVAIEKMTASSKGSRGSGDMPTK